MYYSLLFDGCGTTSVRARTANDAISVGMLMAQRGRKNVRIITPDRKTVPLHQFSTAMQQAE